MSKNAFFIFNNSYRDIDRTEICKLKHKYIVTHVLLKLNEDDMHFRDVKFLSHLKIYTARYFSEIRNCVSPDAPLEKFMFHFETIFSDVNYIPHIEAEYFSQF